MLDQLIVGTALPHIVGDLGGVAHLSWVVTAYVLAATITTPFYGKLGDLYGRKKFLITAIVIFLVGSVLAGQSHSMAELISFRAVQGLGAGGLMVGVIATIGDLVPPRERGQYMGYMMAVMMLAMIAGPLVGGTITDNFSWRWIFYINVPVGGAALVVPRHRHAHAAQPGQPHDRLSGRRAARRGGHGAGLARELGRHTVRVVLAADHVARRAGGAGHGRVHLDRDAGKRADTATAPVPQSQLLDRLCHDLPDRVRDVRRDHLPAALPADRAGRVGDGQRPAVAADTRSS